MWLLDSCKLKEFADNNFKVGENGRKFSKRVEYTNVLLRAISPFPTVFSKTCTANTKKQALVWERVKAFVDLL